jgi:hypothetical protein
MNPRFDVFVHFYGPNIATVRGLTIKQRIVSLLTWRWCLVVERSKVSHVALEAGGKLYEVCPDGFHVYDAVLANKIRMPVRSYRLKNWGTAPLDVRPSSIPKMEVRYTLWYSLGRALGMVPRLPVMTRPFNCISGVRWCLSDLSYMFPFPAPCATNITELEEWCKRHGVPHALHQV